MWCNGGYSHTVRSVSSVNGDKVDATFRAYCGRALIISLESIADGTVQSASNSHKITPKAYTSTAGDVSHACTERVKNTTYVSGAMYLGE